MSYSEIELLTPLAQAASTAIREQDGDYIEGGLLYCGKCHTPKELVIAGLTVRCLCQCAEERRDCREREKKLEETRAMKSEWVSWKGTPDMRPSRAASIKDKVLANLDGFVQNGWSLVLQGGTGCGKTTAAGIIATEALNRGYKVYMATVPDMIGLMFAEETRDKLYNRLNSFDLVVIDDLGSERKTEYGISSCFQIVDRRVNSGKFTIVTTNLEVKNRDDLEYQRIMSRLSSFVVVDCGMQDFRKGEGEARAARIREMLEGGGHGR